MNQEPRPRIDEAVQYHRVKLRFYGDVADQGEFPASELVLTLQGWSNLLQFAYYASETNTLELPRPGTIYRAELRVRHSEPGSFIITLAVYLAKAAVQGVIGNRADAALVRTFAWMQELVTTTIASKRHARRRTTIDDLAGDIEAVAKVNGLRIRKDREVSVDFASAVYTSLQSATAPLDSAAAIQILELPGQSTEILIDRAGRQAIRTPLDEPEIDPTVGPIIEADVKFIRINKKTLRGLLRFVRPLGEAQVGQQNFVCADKAMRRRANVYTRAFHEDVELPVRLQLRGHESGRRGHYWLIEGPVAPNDDPENLPFGQDSTSRSLHKTSAVGKSQQKKPRKKKPRR